MAAPGPSARTIADHVLSEQLRTAYDDNRQLYGSPRFHAELADAGGRLGKKCTARLTRQAELVGRCRRRRSLSITKQNLKAEAAPDLVDRNFVATRSNQLWVADTKCRRRQLLSVFRAWFGHGEVTTRLSRSPAGNPPALAGTVVRVLRPRTRPLMSSSRYGGPRRACSCWENRCGPVRRSSCGGRRAPRQRPAVVAGLHVPQQSSSAAPLRAHAQLVFQAR